MRVRLVHLLKSPWFPTKADETRSKPSILSTHHRVPVNGRLSPRRGSLTNFSGTAHSPHLNTFNGVITV